MEKKKMIIRLEHRMPRGKMPPPSKVFKDRKKEANKRYCRKRI